MVPDRGPAVSVIVTSYNQARHITLAIDSVLQQTFPDREIIVVDDGSTDNSLDVLTAIARRHGQAVRICTHSDHGNRGITETYSLGISKARAPYLAFLEGDDAWAPNYLAEKVRVFHQFPDVGVVFSPCKIRLEGTYGIDMRLRQAIVQTLLPKQKAFNNFRNLLRHNNIATFSSFMARSSLVRSLPLPDASRLMYLDWWMLVQLSMRSAFYFDTNSYVGWQQSKVSFLGRQTFEDHKTSLPPFFDEMYCSVDEYISHLADEDIAVYQKKRDAKPHFVAFYLQPSFPGFLRLCQRDPRWALESVASYLINYLKRN